MKDDDGHNKSKKETGRPLPDLDLVLLGCEILNHEIVATVVEVGVLLKEGNMLTALLQPGVEATIAVIPDGLQGEADDLVLYEELGKGGADHDHDTWPEKPVTGRWKDTVLALEGGEVSDILPWLIIAAVNTDSLAVVNSDRADDTPREEGTDEHRNGGVETNEHTRSEESWSPLNEPSPVLDVHGPVRVSRPNVEPCENVPVVKNTDTVVRSDSVDKSATEGPQKTLELLHGIISTTADAVHRADGHRSGGGSWEDQREFFADLNDEELAEWCGHEETEIRGDDGECKDTSNILLWRGAQEIQLIHSWKRCNEDHAHTTGT